MSTRIAKATTLALSTMCVGFSLVAVVQQLGFGKGYRWLESERSSDADLGVTAIEREQFKLPAAASFSNIEAQPVFNEDRKPTPQVTTEEVANVTPPTPPLNVTVTGVILTPEVHLAMLRDNAKNQALTLKEGMPMPGEAGGWTLTTIKPRSVVFKGGGDDVEIELTTTASSPPMPPPGFPPAVRPPPPPPTANNIPRPDSPPQSKQAEELQHRIEERRRQMREEAEKLKQQSQSPPNP